MKTVAFLTPDLASGGSERVASRLTKLLSGKYRVLYIVFSDEDVSYEIDGELLSLGVPSGGNLFRKVLHIFRKTARLHRICREKKIDLLFSFTDNANLTMRLSGLRRLGCRMIGACRGFDDLSRHPNHYHKVIRAGGELLFNSHEQEAFYLSKYPQDKKFLHTIENLFDCDRIEQMAQEPLTGAEKEFFESHRVICNCGIFSRHKGQWDLLKSFSLVKQSIPDAGLVLIGGHRGGLQKEITQMAANSEYAADILLLGHRENPFAYLAKSRVYALSSIAEGFPNAMMEAMICRTPVVATACATGPNEILYDTYRPERPKDHYVIADNGILTPVFDGICDFDDTRKGTPHRIFADAIVKLLNDPALAGELAAKGYCRGRKNDESKIAEAYIRLIEQA